MAKGLIFVNLISVFVEYFVVPILVVSPQRMSFQNWKFLTVL